MALPLIEREAVMGQLHTLLTQACQGQQQVVFVTGEAGIGKTAVVDTFLTQSRTGPPLYIATGQCVERYGTEEAYRPILEALGQLCRQQDGDRLVPLLRQQAPTWLVQMPWLLTAADRTLLQHELQGTTRERMLREFAAVVETLTAQTPLLLVLEDLHWSDYATLDLLAFLARRRTRARLLLLGTYRPAEVMVQEHPLRTVVQDLWQHAYGRELPLTLLSESGVAQYLASRFPGHAFPDTVATWLSQHTEGNPLFLRTMVDALSARGWLAEQAGQWRLQASLDTAAMAVPEGLQSLLEQQVERLPPEPQRVLSVASVVGVTFPAAAVAAGLEVDIIPVEMLCNGLVCARDCCGHWRKPSGPMAPSPCATSLRMRSINR
jgi:predicted ATPase